MDRRKFCTKALSVLLAISVFLSLLLLGLPLLARPGFIRREYARPGFPPSTRFSPQERLYFSEATLHYLLSDEDIGYLRSLADEKGPIYNERELAHMEDVKGVMRGALLVQRGALIVALLCLSVLGVWREIRAMAKAILAGSAGLIGFVSVVGLTAALNFNLFFTLFHRLFFEGNSWLFAYTDSLIQLYPLPFWVDATRQWLSFSLGISVLLGVGSAFLLRKSPR
ncbi:MAG: TIGR01906 family membrane protein [Chloroflexi bacterium]|nr:MAG: TIGR01906 family membrane protein [Chloroflexota bacterium]